MELSERIARDLADRFSDGDEGNEVHLYACLNDPSEENRKLLSEWLASTIAPHLALAPSPAPAADADDYVAWCTYERDEREPDIERVVLCDSDTKGAFKVYRRPAADAPAPQGEAQQMKSAMLARLWAIQSDRMEDEEPEETMKIDALLSTIAADLEKVQLTAAAQAGEDAK